LFLFKKSQALFGVLAFFLSFSPLNADPFFSSDPDVTLLHLPDKMLSDLPRVFDPPNPWIFLAGSGLTAADWVFEDSSNPWPRPLKDLNVSGLWDFGNFYGEGWVEGFGGVGCWAWGGLTSDLRLAEFGRDASESLVLATVLATGLKVTVNRERPDDSNHFSFPSGHTITAFCVAPVIEKYGGDELGIPAYVLAAVTGLARVEGEHHYLSDVLAGATLGILLGNMVVEKPKEFSVSAGSGGILATWVFN
jgi:membrane-associated phospholipid phosphatase